MRSRSSHLYRLLHQKVVARTRRALRAACARVRPHANTWFALGAVVVGGVIIGGVATRQSAIGRGSLAISPLAESAHAASEIRVRRWIDGAEVPSFASRDVLAVIVDHSPEARPQFGLAAAPLVFEVPVEGQRTRFLAVYPSDAVVDAVGPVRSARPYFVGLAEAIGVPVAHVGGSDAALALLRDRPHVNQYYDPPFWRIRSRPAPFNVLTAIADLRVFAAARGWFPQERESFALWPFTAPGSPPTNSAGPNRSATSAIRISFGREGAFDVAWTHDVDRGRYVRVQDGEVYRDASGEIVTATTVVVLHVRSMVLDQVGRLRIPSLEPPIPVVSELSQSASVFARGERIDGTWQWSPGESAFGRFGLRNRAGHPIAIAPGVTWVEIVNVDPEFDE